MASSSQSVDSRIREYHPRCEFHKRFTTTLSPIFISTEAPGSFDMNIRECWATYHRSIRKKLVGVKSTALTFLGNQSHKVDGQAPKTGNFFNPFAFPRYRAAVRGSDRLPSEPFHRTWLYDELLRWQKRMAASIVHQVRILNPAIQINADHGYPCVLLAIPQQPPAEKNKRVWSKLVAVYLLAISNRLAREHGINIEMVCRSSFGALRPSVADCGISTRISLGLVPDAYAQKVIVQAILYTHELLKAPTYFDMPLTSKRLVNTLNTYNRANSLRNPIMLQPTLWDTLWARGDSKGSSFARQFFRIAITPEYLIDQILLIHSDKSLGTIFKDPVLCRETFAQPLAWLFNAFHLKNKSGSTGKTLSIDIEKFTLSTFNWEYEAREWEYEERKWSREKHEWVVSQTSKRLVYDAVFQELAINFAGQTGMSAAGLEALSRPDFPLRHFHNFFEQHLKDFFFHPPKVLAAEDGYGSDSDCEASFDLPGASETLAIFSKKFITATGMRAIQLAYAIARVYLSEVHQVDTLEIGFNAQDMYYETTEALNEHPIPVPIRGESTDRGKQQIIGFFDQNHCNATQSRAPQFVFGPHDKIFVLDITSSTTEEIRDQLLSYWNTRPELEVILTVSSGLKNEQGMSDYNPYGTIRIFARNRAYCEWLHQCLAAFEDHAGYKHPGVSHWLRRTAKAAGMTPTNEQILDDQYEHYQYDCQDMPSRGMV